MPRRIGCGEPDHLTRSGQPGFQVEFGVRHDLPGTLDQPVVPHDGYLCGACAPVVNLRRALELQVKNAQLAATRQKLLTLGLTVEDVDTFVPTSAAAMLLVQSTKPTPDERELFAAADAAVAAIKKRN
jgi:hypothetical protein